MKNKELVLCDLDSGYITMFASYLMEHVNGVSIHIFTTPESFFLSDTAFDVGILSAQFDEVASFRQSKAIKKKYLLCEEITDADPPEYLYKYQSMENLLGKIPELTIGSKSKKVMTRTSGTSFTGVYSPISHELMLPFSLAVSNSFKDKANVLFLDLEEISIMPQLLGVKHDKNLMDLMYELSANNFNESVFKEYVHQFMGVDYIEPFINPDEISQIDEETWKRLFSVIKNQGYDRVVVLFGRAVCGFSEIISSMDNVFVLGKPGDYFKRAQEAFFDYLKRINIEVPVENVLLPMSAGNLTDGVYCIEELLQGRLGHFVKRLVKDQIKQSQVAYG